MKSDEERAYMAEVERRWDRESWYRRPDGRLDWLALEGYLIGAVMILGVIVIAVQEAVGG
jgi:hypothetical protein